MRALVFFLATIVLDISPSFAGPAGWSRLPPIPDAVGFAGPFAGVNGGALIVAGGANFPDRKPWEGGTKVWYDGIFLLDRPDGVWRAAGRLKEPLGYGVSLTVEDGVLCLGGGGATRHSREAFRLRRDGNGVRQEPLPALPGPVANACGAVVDEVVYLAGGIGQPDATAALGTFWALDLGAGATDWEILPGWPGSPRMLAVAGVHGGAFYLFGGAGLRKGADGKPEREWLRDAYRYRPGSGWKRIADLARASVAAPSPAPVMSGKLLILGGDDGSQLATPPDAHSGFPRTVLAYDPVADAWENGGELPFSLVTTPAVRWNDRVIVPGGEARPGIRSTEVWSLRAEEMR